MLDNELPRNILSGSHNYIASQPERLFYVPTGMFSASRTVTLSTGQVLFKVNPERRRSRTTSVRDASGTPLFEFRFEPHWFKQNTYSAYSTLNGFNEFGSTQLWEMSGRDQRATNKWKVISFPIGASVSKFRGLAYRQRYRGRLGGELLRGELVVAKVEKTSMWSKKYVIDVPPGIDMALVVSIMAAVEYKLRNEGGAT
jgi:hypothetical protein